MTVDLTDFTADARGDNAARVQELLDLAAGMDDGVPVVMLPVRMETRFVKVDVPVASPLQLADLAALLGTASRLLGEIAARDLATVREGTVADHKRFKEQVENPMCERVARELREAIEAIDEAGVLARSPLDGDPASVDEVEAAVAGIRAGLKGAAESLTRLRSDWQRERLTAQLAELEERAGPALETVEGRVMPATRLRAALEGRADPERRVLDPDAASRGVALTVPISTDALAAGAETFEAVLAGVRSLGDDPAAAIRLAGAATTIALLPARWKLELAEAVEEARRTGAALPADLDALAAAVAGIRSGDPKLDETVVRPEIVVTLPGATVVEDRLLVRIYPDDIAVDTHEEQLTAEEVAAGKAFWQQTAAAGAVEPAQRAAWRALCAGRGPRRAAWIARRTEPPAPAPSSGAERAERILKALKVLERRVEEVAKAPPGERLEALQRAAEGLAEELSTRGAVPQWAIDEIRERFAAVRAAVERLDREADRRAAAEEEREWLRRLLERIERRIERLRAEEPQPPPEPDVGELKEGSWTRAARSGVLPERFLVVAVSGDEVAHAVAGAPVPADLRLSVDPDPDDPASEEFRLDEDGELVVGESIRWMVDYDEALAKGMAVTIPITPREARQGFDFVYAIGLRGGGADEGAERLEGLLDNHHYGQTALGVVPVGTPTNNSDAETSGFGSTDDADEEFGVERGEPLIDGAAPLDEGAPDGLRVARALGVDPAALAHVRGAGGSDAADAQAMGAALYPATIGAALEEHAAPLISRDARARLRAFALENVAARGLVPALRVGPQPYGLLPATSHSEFAADGADAEVPATERAAQARFDELLIGVLREMTEDWAAIRADKVGYATDPHVTDPRAHFLTLLGLEAVSSVASYRFAVNVAGRHGVASRDPDLEFGLPPAPGEPPRTGARFGPFALLERFQPILAEAFGVNPGAAVLVEGQVSDAYAEVYEALQDSRAYELRLLKRSYLLHGAAVDPDPAADLAALAAATPAQLSEQAASGHGDQPLLRLLARQALLLEWRDAAVRILLAEGLVSEQTVIDAGASAHFVVRTLYEPNTLTRWSYLFEVLSELQRIQGMPFAGPLFTHLSNGQMSMADFLTASGATGVAAYDGGRYVPELQAVQRHAASLAALGSLPAARLEELMREHLDIAGHRLDAWVTGLAQRRLVAMRADTPIGAHVGAYGWVEDLRPDGDDELAENVPAALDGDPSRPVYRAEEKQGFVHAPSVDHAVTAAILRSGYLSQRGEQDVENRMAVNLSSRRTRIALGLIDGVRAGNRLGALLGYRLERFLHDYHAGGVTLDAVIGPLRSAFPSPSGVDAMLNPDAAARQVCDGLAIVDRVMRWIDQNAPASAAGRTVYDILSDGGTFTGHPWGLGDAVPETTDDVELDGVIRAIDQVADALDAVADLVVAEAVHQIALGNHERAAAVLSSLGEGKAPPRPEVVDTPRSGTPLTHRLMLALPDAAGAPAGWAGIPLTARATAEPVLNAWAAALLGTPGDIRLRLEHADDGTPAGEVTVADLDLQALDLVAIVGPGLETGLGEIAVRALDSRRPAELDDATPPRPLRVELGRDPSWNGDVRSLVEVAPLLEAISGLLGRARPANAQDYVLGEREASAGGSGVAMDDLTTRVEGARDELAGAAVELLQLLAEDAGLGESDLPADPRGFLAAQDPVPDPPRWSTRETWRSALIRATAFGVPAGLPPERYETRVQVRRALRASAETAFVELVERLARADEALAGDPTESALAAAARAVFGEEFTIVPRVELRNRGELDVALAAGLASPAAVEGWLEGAATVRESAAAMSDLRVLADAGGADLPAAAVAQLPHAAGKQWLGGDLPAEAPREGRLSLVLLGPDALPAEGATGSSLLVDEWSETIPSREETTGVAVYSDQPDATAPQCVLIAVPPQKRGAWRLGDLLQTLHDTLELAKSRAVELEHLQDSLYGQLLPLISGELVPEAAIGQPVPDTRVTLDFGANN